MTTLTAQPDPTTRSQYEPGSWSITWKGDRWHETDLTGEHLAWLCLLDGHDTWAHLDLSDLPGLKRLSPKALAELNPINGPVRLMSLIACCVAIKDAVADADLVEVMLTGADDDVTDEQRDRIFDSTMRLAELLNEVRSTPITDLLECFTIH